MMTLRARSNTAEGARAPRCWKHRAWGALGVASLLLAVAATPALSQAPAPSPRPAAQPFPAAPQTGGAQAPAAAPAGTRQGERFGAWTLLCEALGPGRTRCVLLQSLARQEGGQQQLILQAQLEGLEAGESPRLALRLPLGIDLATPVKLQVDGGRSWTVPHIRCQANGCLAGAALSEADLRSLMTGQTLRIEVNVDGESRPVDIALVGLQSGRTAISP